MKEIEREGKKGSDRERGEREKEMDLREFER